jgi:hypothetical protein
MRLTVLSQKIRRVFLTAEEAGKGQNFLIFSAALIFGIFLWRQRLISFPLNFSFRVFGNAVGSHIFWYFLSFFEVPFYGFAFAGAVFALINWLSKKTASGIREVAGLCALNCLWLYLLPVNFYLTKGYTQGYPNPIAGNSLDPFAAHAPLVYPLGFGAALCWFIFSFLITAVLILEKVGSFSDGRIFRYLGALLGGFSLSIFLSFIINRREGDFYFCWYLAAALAVFLFYCFLARLYPESAIFISAAFSLLAVLPLGYRFFASFGMNIYFFAALLLAVAAALAYFFRSRSGGGLRFFLLYCVIPALVFVFFFYPRPESTITPQHTASMFYIPYEAMENGRLLLRDYPLIFRSFFVDTGFVAFFKAFGFSIYKARIALRVLEPYSIVIAYFILLRLLPWYAAALCILLIRTNYLWLNFTAYTADWPTHIRYIYADLAVLALIMFFQQRRRVYLYFTSLILPLIFLNSPDFGYSLIPAAIISIAAFFFFRGREAFREEDGRLPEEKVFLAVFAAAYLAFLYLILTLLSCAGIAPLDYPAMFLYLSLAALPWANYCRRKPFIACLNRKVWVLFGGLVLTAAVFAYYLLRIKSLGMFLLFSLRAPFFQLAVTPVAKAHFSEGASYQPPVYGGDIGYFILWHLPVIICFCAAALIAWQLFFRKERDNPRAYILLFLAIAALAMYMRSMVLGEELKVVYSMHIFWFLLIALISSAPASLSLRRHFLCGVFLLNFIPTLPLFFSPLLGERVTYHQLNNFYITSLDAELRHLPKRNVSREYLRGKFNGYFGNLQWFRDNEEDLYRDFWAEENVRLTRSGLNIEKKDDIENTAWPRKPFQITMDVDYLTCRGKFISFGWWLKVERPGRVRVLINDGDSRGAFSDFHAGGDKWEFLTVTKKIKQEAEFVKVGMQIEPGAVIFKEESGDAAWRIGPYSAVLGAYVPAPENRRAASMLHILWRKAFNEVDAYLDSGQADSPANIYQILDASLNG